MNKRSRLVRIVIAAVLALPMAGASAGVLAEAFGFAVGGAWIGLPAAAAVLLGALAAGSGALAMVAAVLAAALGGAGLWANAGALAALRDWLAALVRPDLATGAEATAQAGAMFAAIAAALLGAAYFALLFRRGGTPFALLIFFAIFISCYAAAEEMSFLPAAPGLVAAVEAFALSGEVPRDAGAWRVLAPTAVVVGLALLLMPASGLTWEPLERAAQTVRSMFEDYFRFTEERIPYTISTEGYNHASEVEGEVVALLGGPANPDAEPVMRVTSDSNVLLRGSIRRTYTGNSWVDDDPKARYLFYDFTRGSVRSRVFGMDGNEAFVPVRVEVEMLAEGTSSLFVTGRLESFDMPLDTAVYYNSIGELFLSRRVQPGDSYSLTGWQAGPEVRAAVIAAQADEDPNYEEALETCLLLPDGIDAGVYELVAGIVEGCDNDFDRAAAIEAWLYANCTYTLEPGYPDAGRDFVSQFVLETREGYCSYFATAMAVMCRIAGVPARYVEGYSVPAGEDVVVTGEDAHAWTEVYFNGIGWVAFDPSNGSGGASESGAAGGESDPDDTADRVSESDLPQSGDPDATPPSSDDGATLPPEGEPSPTPNAGEPTPTLPPEGEPSPTPDAGEPTPTLPPDAGEPTPTLPPDAGDSSPSPTPDAGFMGEPTPTPPPGASDADPPDGGDSDRDLRWLWILLAALLLLLAVLLAALWVRSRLRATDPMRLSAAAPTAAQAMLILYRSMLTLLAQQGQGPLNGESPGGFARRACPGNGDFAAFADSIALCAYARRGADREAVERGRRAYQAMLASMRRGERLRFALARIFRGLGDFSAIP